MIPGSPVPVQVERASRGATPHISPVRLLARAGEMFLAESKLPSQDTGRRFRRATGLGAPRVRRQGL